MLKKLDIYIIKKFLGTFFFSILLIMSIAIIFDISEKIDDFIEKQAPLQEIIFNYYFNFVPYFANLFSPLFIFISVIFFTSKMAFNTEIIAILSNGVSFRRLMLPYFISALFLAIFSFGLSNFVIPNSNKIRLAFEQKYIKNPYRNFNRNIHKQIKPGVYIYLESYNVENNIGYKFSIEKFIDNILVSKLNSSFIKWDSIKNTWTVHNYYIHNFKGAKEEITKGDLLDTNIVVVPKDFNQNVELVETMDLFRLNNFIDEQKLQGSENIDAFVAEKYKRLANSFSTFILTLIGVSISSRKVRGGIGLHLGIGLLLSFSYILFMQLSTNIAMGGSMPLLLGIWIPNIIFLIIGIFLYRTAPK